MYPMVVAYSELVEQRSLVLGYSDHVLISFAIRGHELWLPVRDVCSQVYRR
jgi:hypothetical protein